MKTLEFDTVFQRKVLCNKPLLSKIQWHLVLGVIIIELIIFLHSYVASSDALEKGSSKCTSSVDFSIKAVMINNTTKVIRHLR